MSCRPDLPLVLGRWRRFSRARRADDQAAMDAVLAVLTDLARGTGRATLVLAGRDVRSR